MPNSTDEESMIVGLNGLYKAPEVLLSAGDELSEKSDIWSLGVSLFVLATGDFPFKTHGDVLASNL